jgi:hypothetical protein
MSQQANAARQTTSQRINPRSVCSGEPNFSQNAQEIIFFWFSNTLYYIYLTLCVLHLFESISDIQKESGNNTVDSFDF